MLTAARKASLMVYCRLDELAPGEDEMLTALYEGAVSYLEQAGVSQPEAGTGRAFQFDQVVNALVLDGWDNRSSQMVGVTAAENPAMRRMINQLKLTEPVPYSGT